MSDPTSIPPTPTPTPTVTTTPTVPATPPAADSTVVTPPPSAAPTPTPTVTAPKPAATVPPATPPVTVKQLGDAIVSEFQSAFENAQLTQEQSDIIARAATAMANATLIALTPPTPDALTDAVDARNMAVATLANVFEAASLNVIAQLQQAALRVFSKAIQYGVGVAIANV